MKAGKYKGQPYELLKQDRPYCNWLLHHAELTSLPRNLQKTKQRLTEEAGGVLMCGAHRNSFYTEILQKKPDYGEWAASLEDPGPAMKEFTTWMKKRKDAPSEEEDPQKRSRQGGYIEKCVVCTERPAEACFFPCGHLVCCMNCAALVQPMCPMCRVEVGGFVKVYT